MLYLTQHPIPTTAPDLERPLMAADGYLTLGMPHDALRVVQEIAPAWRNDSAVLRARVRILLHLKLWKRAEWLAGEGVRIYPRENEFLVQRAFALHQQRRGEEAVDVLRNAPEWLRRTGILHYNLACYEAQLGDLRTARQCIRTAIELNAAFRKNAKTDPDLQALWN